MTKDVCFVTKQMETAKAREEKRPRGKGYVEPKGQRDRPYYYSSKDVPFDLNMRAAYYEAAEKKRKETVGART